MLWETASFDADIYNIQAKITGFKTKTSLKGPYRPYFDFSYLTSVEFVHRICFESLEVKADKTISAKISLTLSCCCADIRREAAGNVLRHHAHLRRSVHLRRNQWVPVHLLQVRSAAHHVGAVCPHTPPT